MRKEVLLNFYQTNRFFIFPAVVAISSIFLIIFAVYPQITRLISGRETEGSLNARFELLNAKAAALENYDSEDLSKKLNIALGSLPIDKDFGNIIGLLQQIITGSGFSIDSISFSNSSPKTGNVQSFSLKIEVKGSKEFFGTLLNNLESSPRLLKINSIDISSNQASQGLSVSLGMDVLYSSVSKSAGTADSPIPELSQKDEDLIVALSKVTSSLPAGRASSTKGKSNPFE